jgi:hypothetical protein
VLGPAVEVLHPTSLTTHLLLQNLPTLFLILIGFGLIYTSAKVIYRLFVGPLSRFPGPKLAATTYLYEFYHTAIRADFASKVQELHTHYGKNMERS